MNQGNQISACELMNKIQAISFAKVETELYLDAHPECTPALDYYKELCQEYDNLVSIYENTVGPLTHESAARDSWRWVSKPWPWQYEKEN